MSVQPNLEVGTSNDAHEREADRVSGQDVRMQLKPANGDRMVPAVSPAIERHVSGLRSGGRPLPDSARRYFEPRFGSDFSHVRIHTGVDAAQAAKALHARAFTLGRDIAFGTGHYDPGSTEGRRLLSHELTHVVQQGRHGKPMLQRAETDDTQATCRGLSDTKSQVNQHVNQAIASARTKSTGKGTDTFVDEVYDQLGAGRSSHPGRTKIEDHLETTLAEGKQIRQPAQSSTKYAGVAFVLWGGVPLPLPWALALGVRIPIRVLGAALKVNDICIGTDKLGHFFQQGHEYYEIAHRKGKGETAAEEYGIKTEVGKFGLATTGVFSNADLEANRRGLAFYDDLAANRNLRFDAARYVSNQWNEATNPNYYHAAVSVADRIWANLLTGSWSGEFTNDRDPRQNIPVTMMLRVTPRRTAKDASGNVNLAILRGTYAYEDTSGNQVKGKLLGGVSFRTLAVAPSVSKQRAVEGVRIKFSWKQGGAKGRGIWISGGESLLQGTWGRGTSTDNGGLWWATKV